MNVQSTDVNTQENFNQTVLKLTQATVFNIATSVKKMALEKNNNTTMTFISTNDLLQGFQFAPNWSMYLNKCNELQKKMFASIVLSAVSGLEKTRNDNDTTNITAVLEKSEGVVISNSNVVKAIAFHTMATTGLNKK